MARPKKARVEGEAAKPLAEPSPAMDAATLADIIDAFKALYPDDWEALRLCPLQHGIEAICDKMKAHT